MQTKPTTRRKSFASKFTPEQRAEYKQQQRDEAQKQLEAAVASLQNEEGFQAWLTARARFHRYSLSNTFLIQIQCPEATRVAAASLWRDMGRFPKKGSHAIRVFAPMEWSVKCDRDDEGARWNPKKERWEKRLKTFKLVPVFDVSQTDGDPLPDAGEPAMLTGDSHAHLEAPLVTLAAEHGYRVVTEGMTGGRRGYCDPANKVIALADNASPNERVHILVHEIAHAHGVDYEQYTRPQAEMIVESVTYIVMAGQGFDISPAAVPYIAGWTGKDGAEKMQQFAETIDTIARKIESAL